MRRLSRFLFTLLAISLSIPACKGRRASDDLANNSDVLPGVKEVGGKEDTKDQANEDEIRRLADEKALSDQKLAELQKVLLDIENKMATDGMLTEAQRAELQKQLDQIKKDKDAAEAARLALEAEQKKALEARKRFAIFYDKPEANVKDDCLVFDGDLNADGSLLRVKPCDFAAPQQFYIEYKNEVEFRLVSKVSNKCVVVAGASKNADLPLQQLSCGNAAAETFKLIEKSPNEYYIQNVNSQLCMKIIPDGNVRQNNCQTTASPLRLSLIEGP